MQHSILHIIPDFLNTQLYNLLILSLESADLNNIVYIPENAKIEDREYKVDVLQKKFNILDRVIYIRKQYCIYADLKSKAYTSNVRIIHAHNLFSSGFAAMLLARKKNIPYVIAVRNTDINIFFRYMIHLRWLGVHILKNAHKIIFISPAYKIHVLKKYIPSKYQGIIANKSIVIPNGIDKLFLKNLYLRKRLKFDKTVTLLYVGEIVKNKNIETTICGCLELKAMGYQVIFSVVGKIVDTNIMNIIKQHRFILYHPHCEQQEILKYMRESDIFVMPSITETFGLVYVEAMTQGMPIIYSKGQGIDGYFSQGEVGYAVDCFDAQDILRRILDIYEDYNNISQRCIACAQKFEWKKIAINYKEDVYNII